MVIEGARNVDFRIPTGPRTTYIGFCALASHAGGRGFYPGCERPNLFTKNR